MATTPFLLAKMIEQHPFASLYVFVHLGVEFLFSAKARVHDQARSIFYFLAIDLSAKIFVTFELGFAACVAVHTAHIDQSNIQR